MEFGIFYIPKHGALYDLGSSILGYDIRHQKSVPMHPSMQQSWVTNIKQYGFHMTITDAVQIEEGQLPDLVTSFKELLRCFAGQGPFVLPLEQAPVAFWENNPTQAALRYQPTTALAVLHAALVVHLQAKGKGSTYYTLLQNNKIPASWNDDKIAKTKLFFSPYIFDEFKPHFSLVNPFVGDEKDALIGQLTPLFSSFHSLQIDSLCLVTRKDPEAFFSIYEEVELQ